MHFSHEQEFMLKLWVFPRKRRRDACTGCKRTVSPVLALQDEPFPFLQLVLSLLANWACVDEVVPSAAPTTLWGRFLHPRGSAAFGEGSWCAGPSRWVLRITMPVAWSHCKLAIIRFLHYHFSIWEVENHFECVEADKYSGPGHFLSLFTERPGSNRSI